MNKKLFLVLALIALLALYGYSPTITGSGFGDLTTAPPSGIGNIKIVEGDPFSGVVLTQWQSQPGPATASSVVEALAQIDKKLVDGIFEK